MSQRTHFFIYCKNDECQAVREVEDPELACPVCGGPASFEIATAEPEEPKTMPRFDDEDDSK